MIPTDVLIEAITDAYLEVDREGRVCLMNGEAERLLRIERSSAIGRPLDQVIPDTQKSDQWPELAAAVARSEAKLVSVFHPTIYRWHEVRVVPHGEIVGLLLRDVTDRQWLLRREAERVYLRHVFEDAPVAITLMRGPTLQIEYMNTLARQIIGPREIVGLEARVAFADLEQKELFDLLENVYHSGQRRSERDLHIRFDRNGDGRLEDTWFDVSWQPVGDFDGKVTGVLSISVEVTDRRQATPGQATTS